MGTIFNIPLLACCNQQTIIANQINGVYIKTNIQHMQHKTVYDPHHLEQNSRFEDNQEVEDQLEVAPELVAIV